MRIKSVSFARHKVLGATRINMFADSENSEKDLLNRYHSDIVIDVEPTSGENTYTYIIGDNGVGKTVFFRSVIHYININDTFHEPKLDEFINLYTRNLKYVDLFSRDRGHAELVDYELYNHYFNPMEYQERNFLKFHGAQLISISSTHERSIVHKNPHFRSFNYLSDINQTKILFLKALKKYGSDEKISHLSSLLGQNNIQWSISCGLSFEAVGEIRKNLHAVLLKTVDGVNIWNFLSVLDKMRLENGKVDVEALTSREIEVFEQIYNSGSFFHCYFTSGLSLGAFFEAIKDNSIIVVIKAFLKSLEDLTVTEGGVDINKIPGSSRYENSANVKIDDAQRGNWGFLFTDVEELSVFELNFLGLLQSLGLVDIDIQANGISIESMSSGQKNLIRLFSFFSELPIAEQVSDCVVFIDEPENSLHPKWQQEYPTNFKNIVEKVYGIRDSHFIFATHSPVLIMKSAQIEDTNVLRFYKDDTGNFHSQVISNVNSYSIEEVLLDEFRISYRDQAVEHEVKRVLDENFASLGNGDDPINSVTRSFQLRDKINALYNKFNKRE